MQWIRYAFFYCNVLLVTNLENEQYPGTFFYFTSTDALMSLLHTERKLIGLLDDYIEKEYGRLDRLRRLVSN